MRPSNFGYEGRVGESPDDVRPRLRAVSEDVQNLAIIAQPNAGDGSFPRATDAIGASSPTGESARLAWSVLAGANYTWAEYAARFPDRSRAVECR